MGLKYAPLPLPTGTTPTAKAGHTTFESDRDSGHTTDHEGNPGAARRTDAASCHHFPSERWQSYCLITARFRADKLWLLPALFCGFFLRLEANALNGGEDECRDTDTAFFSNCMYLCWAVLGLRCCVGFSLVAMSRTTLQLPCEGSSLRRLLLLQRASRCPGFCSCGTWAQ